MASKFIGIINAESVDVSGNIRLTGTATTTNQARTIDFTGFDKESTTDFTDRAYIQHTVNTGGHSGSVLLISSQNDANDGIAFATNGSSMLKHNGNTIWTAGNDGAGSGLDADTVDGVQASSFLRSDTWAAQQGGVNITKNIGTSITWTDGSSQLSLENTDAGWVGINFHRTGYTSNNIYHNGSNFTMDSSVSVSGNITASGDVTAYSDARLKSDVVTIDGALDKVSALRGVDYIKDGKPSTGVIAQEVEAVKPELVHTADDEMGTKSVAYGNMAGLFIEAIKELKDEVASLKAEIAELKK